jgi:hypothetical protein
VLFSLFVLSRKYLIYFVERVRAVFHSGKKFVIPLFFRNFHPSLCVGIAANLVEDIYIGFFICHCFIFSFLFVSIRLPFFGKACGGCAVAKLNNDFVLLDWFAAIGANVRHWFAA